MSAWVAFALVSGAGLALVLGIAAWLNRGERASEEEVDRQTVIW